MPLRDLLKKRDKIAKSDAPVSPTEVPTRPQFTFLRSDTNTQEVIRPPSVHRKSSETPPPSADGPSDNQSRLSIFKGRSRSNSAASNASRSSDKSKTNRSSKRLSQRLGLRKDDTSSNVPQDLPSIDATKSGDEAWEERATILARENEKNRSRPETPRQDDGPDLAALKLSEREDGVVSSKVADDNIQEAIRLHEAGELEKATRMFGRLADPEGENNPLSQVLYGLALRHGWGCVADPEKGMNYLTAAASNAASVESLALHAGVKGGGAAKGELVLAIFELANSFRHGWGVKKDPVAAKQYYETAANLGDTDAMNEAGWCYLEGFGCKKDKMAAAQYYRRAEKGGSKILGNTWFVNVSFSFLILLQSVLVDYDFTVI